jgi:hypothetical protein
MVVMPPSDRPGEPIRLADVADPEGNVLSIAQPVQAGLLEPVRAPRHTGDAAPA